MIASPPIQMGSLGMADSLILMVLALVVFGPRRLPQIGRQLGKLMYEFRKASNDFKFQMEEELRLSEDADRRKKEEAERQQQAALAPPTLESTPESTTESAPATDPYASAPAPTPAIDSYPPAPAGDDGPRIAPPATGEIIAGRPPWQKSLIMHASSAEPPAAEIASAETAQPVETAQPAETSTPAAAAPANSPEALTHNG